MKESGSKEGRKEGRKEEEDKVYRDRRECIGIVESEREGGRGSRAGEGDGCSSIGGEKKAFGAACDGRGAACGGAGERASEL